VGNSELESIGRVRTLTKWLRETGKPVEEYPKRLRSKQLTSEEIADAKKFAVGAYPMPSRWTVRLYHIAKGN